MIQINFIYKGKNIPIQCTKNEKMKEIFSNFEIKAKIENSSSYYLYNGNKLDNEIKIEEIIGNNDINNINILVNSIDEMKSNNLLSSKYIICPECKECTRIKMNDYKIKLYGCKNGHNIENLLLEEFENKQKIDISKIICDICKKNNKSNTYNNDFYKCNTCKIYICPLCKTSHNKEHNIINYEQKDFICEIHNEIYIKYCNSCKKNICMLCFIQHNKHENISYENIIPDLDSIKNQIIQLKDSIDIFKSEIKKIINNLNEVIKNIDLYYNIYNNIFKNYVMKNRNYEILQNVNEINNNIINDINEINKDNNIINKFKEILSIYNKMKNNKVDIYNNIKNEDMKKGRIDLFCDSFNNNKTHENKELELKTEFHNYNSNNNLNQKNYFNNSNNNNNNSNQINNNKNIINYDKKNILREVNNDKNNSNNNKINIINNNDNGNYIKNKENFIDDFSSSMLSGTVINTKSKKKPEENINNISYFFPLVGLKNVGSICFMYLS